MSDQNIKLLLLRYLGVITPMTGAAAAVGKDMVNGLTLYLEQNGQQLAGRKAEVIV